MRKIALLSDTHAYLHLSFTKHLKESDEIWHVGDIGSYQLMEELRSFAVFRGVYGNIDGFDIRNKLPEVQIFSVEAVKVIMMHIGGYPKKYEPKAIDLIIQEKPDLFISGHSHILKVMYDKKFALMHMNPGAAGKFGFQNSLTMLKFQVEGKELKNLEVVDVKR